MSSSVPVSHDIVKSPNDQNEYRYSTLSNGMGVMYVRTPFGKTSASSGPPDSSSAHSSKVASKPAAVALSTRVGYYADPKEFQGLAHFLEHMLFMVRFTSMNNFDFKLSPPTSSPYLAHDPFSKQGNAKYPGENEWEEFISAHSGYSNASTDAEQTVYQFEVHPKRLLPALDRFAQFFVAPLFAADAVEREVQAVHSEFKETSQNEFSRSMDVVAETCSLSHPLSLFGWGNQTSLLIEPRAKGLDTRAALLDFHAKRYSANHMKLTVVVDSSPESPSWTDLVTAVTEAFSPVPVLQAPAPAPAGTPLPVLNYASAADPFAGACSGCLHKIAPVRDTAVLSITWTLPPSQAAFRSRPIDVIEGVIGHEGPGSLLSLLKRRGLATALTAGVDSDDVSRGTGVWLFNVAVTLTPLGASQWQTAAELVVAAPRMMLSASDADLLRLWDELAVSRATSFQFAPAQEALELAETLVAAMHLYPPSETLTGASLLPERDLPRLRALLGSMTAGRARYDLTSRGVGAELAALPSWDEPLLARDVQTAVAATSSEADAEAKSADIAGFDGATVLKTTYFNVKFTRERLPSSLLKAWDSATVPACLRLPEPNPFLATDVSVLPPVSPWEVAPLVLTSLVPPSSAAEAEAVTARVLEHQRSRLASGLPVYGSGADVSSAPATGLPSAVMASYPALLRDSGFDVDAAEKAAAVVEEGIVAESTEAAARAASAGAGTCAAPILRSSVGHARKLLRHPALWKRSPLPEQPYGAPMSEAVQTAASEGPALKGCELWHLPDSQFRLPRATIIMQLHSPLSYASPLHVVMARLLLGMLDDALEEQIYAAQLADISVETDSLCAGFEIKVSGLSHKLDRVAEAAVDVLVGVRDRLKRALTAGACPVEAATAGDQSEDNALRRFLNVRADVLRYYSQNHFDPSNAAGFLRLYALQRNRFHIEDVIAAAMAASGDRADLPKAIAAFRAAAASGDAASAGAHLTPEAFLSFVEEIIGRGLVLQMFVHGNISPERSISLFDSLASKLGHVYPTCTDVSAPVSETGYDPILRPPPASTMTLACRVRNPTEPATCVNVFHVAGRFTPLLSATLAVVDHACYEPAFNQLRTKEQLGYSVSTDTPSLQSLLGFSVEVTSSSHSAAHVLGSIDAFLQGFRPTLGRTWRSHRASVENSYFAPEVVLSDVTNRIWADIVDRSHLFDRVYRTGRALSSVSRAAVLSLYDAMVLGANTGAPDTAVAAEDVSSCEATGAFDSVLHPSERACSSCCPAAAVAYDKAADTAAAWSGGATPRSVPLALRDDLSKAIALACASCEQAEEDEDEDEDEDGSGDDTLAEAVAAAALSRSLPQPWALGQGRARIVSIAFGSGDQEGALAAVGPLNAGDDAGDAESEEEGEDEDDEGQSGTESDGHEHTENDGSELYSAADDDGDEDEDDEDGGDDEPAPLLDATSLAAVHEKESRITLSLSRPLAVLAWKSGIERVC